MKIKLYFKYIFVVLLLVYSFSTSAQTIYSEDFETNFDSDTNGWTLTSPTSNMNWEGNNNATPSSGTGPDFPNSGIYYAYVESSGTNTLAKEATMTSPSIDLSGYTSPTLSFYYHMYGNNIGDLDLDIDDGSGWVTLNTISGQQQTSNGASWRNTLSTGIDLSAYTGSTVQIRFHATTGNVGDYYRSDFAVDDVLITGTAAAGPEINVQGNTTSISDGDTTPSVTDDTDFGNIGVTLGTQVNTFTVQNTGTLGLNLTSASPYVVVSGTNSADFTVTAIPSNSIAASSSTTFNITFDPSAVGLRIATLTIANDDSNENPYNFDIQGTGVTPLTEGPGGVTNDLELWLKATDGLAYSDGQSVSLWSDQGRGANATVNTSGQEPTYRDNASKNVNFNPVVEFDNSYGTYTLDGDYSYDDTSTQFLEGTSSMYTQDIFVVMIPDETPVTSSFGFMDIFCGDEFPGTDQTDATGIGAGYYTARFSGEIFCFAVGTTSSGDGYGVAEIGTGSTYNNIGIINARINTGATQQELYYNANDIETDQNDLPDFSIVSDSRYWIGRSEGWEASTNARITEIITFSARKDDASLTDERNRIQSYLAIKYGITLGVNGTSQDYVDSGGTVIWNQSVNSGYNHDIAGIGRDDDSDLNQKQSKTVNTSDDITMGLSEIATTNNTNANTFTSDKDFLVWGNDDGTLAAQTAVTLDLSSGTGGLNTIVNYTRIGRVWKVVENGSVETVEVSIPQSMLAATVSPPGEYIMLFSDSPTFDNSSEHKTMSLNGSDLETKYDFNGTKFITFAYAPERVFTRSIYFDGVQDYLDAGDVTDLSGVFTISAWINKDANDGSIVSKRDSGFTTGYDFSINSTGKLEMSWINSGVKSVTSSITIPNNEWHHVAVIYDGTDAKLYIDGVEDTSATATLISPLATSENFKIATGGSAASYFEGNIDEVRVWDTALTEDELHYIMNQEIEDNSNFVSGSYFISIGATLTKNDVSTVPWVDLKAYYPMSTYIYDNCKDESNNGHIAIINNLRTVDYQTAPLPYISTQNGNWDIDSTWLNGSEQTIPGATSIVDSNTTVDWNIVETDHNLTMDNTSSLPAGKNDNRLLLALVVGSNELTLDGDNVAGTGNGITVTHYLELDGVLDLEGESQLIQTEGSDLATSSSGYLERDQQGTQNSFTYNYWSSPVSKINSSVNNLTFNISDVLRDGTDAANPISIEFGDPYAYADGVLSTPIKISNYWIWKFVNLGSDYANWQFIGSTSNLNTTVGYTMKGTSGSSTVSSKQNYVFNGKPNNVLNGATEIVHTTFLAPSGDPDITLAGNPFPSAIDANIFIDDNATSTTQAIYFWEHWGGGTHVLSGYQGGYSTYTKAGSTPTPTLASSHPDVDQTGSGGILPGQYIPVGQGFFVVSSATGGDVIFRNSQRTYEKESGNPNSNFTRSIPIEKIRLGFDSPDHYHRQLLVTFISEATDAIDPGYDALGFGTLSNDSFFIQEDKRFVIQAFESFDVEREIPIVVIIDADEDGMIQKFMIDSLENISSDKNIFLKDNVANIIHDLRESNYEIVLPAGEHKTRFSLVFRGQALDVEDEFVPENSITIFMNNPTSEIVIKNTGSAVINKTTLYNVLGQTMNIWTLKNVQQEINLPINDLSTGVYIVQIETDKGNISQKIIIE